MEGVGRVKGADQDGREQLIVKVAMLPIPGRYPFSTIIPRSAREIPSSRSLLPSRSLIFREEKNQWMVHVEIDFRVVLFHIFKQPEIVDIPIKIRVM